MKSYFYINFVLFLFCFNKFFFGTNNDNELLSNFTYENVEGYVKDEKTFNEAKIMLKNYLHINKLIVQGKITYTKTRHNMDNCINCFTTINKKTYGIRFYKNGKIEIGYFTSLLVYYICQNGFLWDTQEWRGIEKKTIIKRIKQTPKEIVKIEEDIVSTDKTIENGIKTIKEVVEVKEGIEKTMVNADKMNNVLDICCCCQFCEPE